jgi:hypothetical protein
VDDDNAETADVPAAEADNTEEGGSWPVLSDLDLAVCITDSASPVTGVHGQTGVTLPSDGPARGLTNG